MTNAEIKRFNSLKRWLRKHLPIDMPYRVLFTDSLPDDDLGDTILSPNGRCVIHLRKHADYQSIIDDFMHELAHVYSITPNSYKDHPQIYWLKHGEIYNCFLQWLNMQKKRSSK